MFLKVFNVSTIMKQFANGSYVATRVDGNTSGGTLSSSNNMLQNFSNRFGETTKGTGSWIVVGDGNTPVNENDYKLANAINSGITVSTPVIAYPGSFENTPSVTYTLVNTSTNVITINEIGLVFGSTASYPPILFYREVLTNPIILAPSGKHTISFNFIA